MLMSYLSWGLQQQRIQALQDQHSSINFVESDIDIADIAEEDVAFCERFALPTEERPMPGVY